MKENKLDKNQMLKKLQQKQDGGVNVILDEAEFNDVLLDEQILQDDESQDAEPEENIIASESHHNNSN